MIHTIRGTVVSTRDDGFTIECGGIGYRVSANAMTIAKLPIDGGETRVFCHLAVREDRMELFGFRTEEELTFFGILISVSGVGPKTALGVLNMNTVPNLIVAILEKKTDTLTRAPGIGKKTAERIVLELQSKVKLPAGHKTGKEVDADNDVEDVLTSLGYAKTDARAALEKLGADGTFEERLRHALRLLGGK